MVCKFQLMLYVNIVKSPLIVNFLWLILEEIHSSTLDIYEILEMNSEENDFKYSNKCTLQIDNYALERSYIKYMKGDGKENNSWFKTCKCKICYLIRLLYKIILYRDRSKSRRFIADVIIKLCFDIKLEQMFEFLIAYFRCSLNAIEIICSYPKRVTKHIVLLLKIDSIFRKAKRQMFEACLWIPMNISASYCDYGIERSVLNEAGKIGLLMSINRFNFIDKQNFFVYARWWVKQKIIEIIMEKNGGIEYIKNTNNKDNKTVKLKKLSLDYCLDESDMHEDVVDDDEDDLKEEKFEEEDEKIDLPDVYDTMTTAKFALMSPMEERAIRLKAMKGNKLSLSDIGLNLGLTKERVRQLLLNIKNKLKNIGPSNVMTFSKTKTIDIPRDIPYE